MSLKRSYIKNGGIALSICLLIFATIAVILAGLDYNLAEIKWINTPYYATSPLQIACVVFSIVLSFYGFVVFTKTNQPLLISYEILSIISLCFNIAIGCLVITAGSVGYIPLTQGCNAKISGILSIWENIDTYLHNVDKTLCSDKCPCLMANNLSRSDEYNSMITTNESYGAVSFEQCNMIVKQEVLDLTKKNNANFDKDNSFNMEKFAEYMGRIEEKFKCTGWCSIKYSTNVNGSRSNEVYMNKYLFSDVNNGLPEHIGCVDQVIEWLPQYLLSNGTYTIAEAGIQIIIIIMCFMLGNSRGKEENEIIKQVKINVTEKKNVDEK